MNLKIEIAVIVTLCLVYDSRSHVTSQVVEDLFLDYSRRDTPLYSCTGYSDGLKYRIPKTLDCSMPLANESTKAIKLTFFWDDIAMRPIKGYDCYAEKRTIQRYKSFFGSEYQVELPREKIYISETQCKELKGGKAPNGNDTSRISDGFFGTSNLFVPEYTWLKTTESSTINYYYMTTLITVSNEDGTINTMVGLQDSCLGTAGVCPSLRGLLLWPKNEVKTCRIKEGETTGCIMTGNRITCPDVNMALTEVNSTVICDTVVGHSHQGVYFTTDLTGEIYPGVKSTLEVRKKLGLSRRDKRELIIKSKPGSISGPFIATGAEVDAKFQFLYDMIESKHNYAIINLHNSICRSNQMVLDLIRYMAESGNPTALARTLTGDPSYRAKLSGDVLSLYKCTEVWEYYFVHRVNCTSEWPVKYVLGNDQHFGFMSPLSHEIFKNPTVSNCPSSMFYFEMKHNTVLLSNKTIASHLPILPNPGQSFDYKMLPKLSIGGNWQYPLEDISNSQTINGIMRQISNNLIIDKAIGNIRNGLQNSEMENNALDTLKDYSLSSVIETLTFIYIGMCVISGLLLTGFIGYYAGPIFKVLKIIWKVLIALINIAIYPFKRCLADLNGRIVKSQVFNQYELQEVVAVTTSPDVPFYDIAYHGYEHTSPPTRRDQLPIPDHLANSICHTCHR